MKDSFRLSKITFVVIVCCCCAPNTNLYGQFSALPATRSSEAVALVQHAIEVMGGQAWAGVGAATSTETNTDPKNRKYTTTRSDDWSKNSARRRRDLKGSSSTATTLETQGVHFTVRGSKTIQVGPADYDLVGLAEIYPAIALRLALARSRCQFRVLTKADSPDTADIGAVRITCVPSDIHEQQAVFDWWFDASGMPKQVRVPLTTVNSRSPLSHIVKFLTYQQVQGLSVPQTTQVTVSDFVIKTTAISGVSFQTSLPDSTFAVHQSH